MTNQLIEVYVDPADRDEAIEAITNLLEEIGIMARVDRRDVLRLSCRARGRRMGDREHPRSGGKPVSSVIGHKNRMWRRAWFGGRAPRIRLGRALRSRGGADA